MQIHNWTKNVLQEEHTDANGKRHPEVSWFTKCDKCGCQITSNKKELLYRQTSKDEWSTIKPLCVSKAVKV